jgi:hypothetical protein
VAELGRHVAISGAALLGGGLGIVGGVHESTFRCYIAVYRRLGSRVPSSVKAVLGLRCSGKGVHKVGHGYSSPSAPSPACQ